MEVCIFDQSGNLTVDTIIAVSALLVSIVALGLSIYFWRTSFRPIVTAMVITHRSGNKAIAFDLKILNSGTLPAKNIRLRVEQKHIDSALGKGGRESDKRMWLSCFEQKNVIKVLHNNENICCSFGLVSANNSGFWKYKAIIPITIEYEGWFGKKYIQNQELQIIDTSSFTDFRWG